MRLALPRLGTSAGRQSGGLDRRTAVIVLGLTFYTSLNPIRHLGRLGIPVYGLDPSLPLRSRFCRSARCPDPVDEPEALVDLLLWLARGFERPPLLLPTTDAFVLVVSRWRHALAPHFLMALPSPEVVEAGVDKRLQLELARRCGIAVPETFVAGSVADLVSAADDLRYPLFVKPAFSHLWRRRGGTGKGVLVRGAEELRLQAGRLPAIDLPLLAQSVIEGPDTSLVNLLVYIDQRGVALGVCASRKIRQYPLGFGVSALVETVHDPRVVEIGTTFLQAIGYRGCAELEFKRGNASDEAFLIEINPRLSGPGGLATRVGVNQPLLQYLDLTGQPVCPAREYPAGVRWWCGEHDLLWALAMWRQGRFDAAAWLWSLAGIRAISTFALDDPLPWLSLNLRRARLAVKSRRAAYTSAR